MQGSFIHVIDLLGTFSFAVAGAFAAIEKKLDPFGVLIIAFVTAIGGGTIRDVLIGDLPVAWLKSMDTVFVIVLSALLVLFFGYSLKKISWLLILFDAIGLGLFSIIGVEKGLAHQLSPAVCVALGTVTGCFGGVLRDVLLNNVPLIFKKEIYASASILGGVVYVLLLSANLNSQFADIICIALICLTRLLAVKLNWSLPVIGHK